MDQKIKILVCGDVEGKFEKLFSRVETLNKKAGPFEMLFCVGDFFGHSDIGLDAYKNKFKKVPLQTYILGPSSIEKKHLFEDINGCEIASNLTYLGKRGLYTPAAGLKIAYLSGVQSESNIDKSNNVTFDKNDAMSLKTACIRNQSMFRGVDLLLTHQWPKYVTDLDPSFDDKYDDSDIISWLAVHLKPRYHFASHKRQYFERKPYRNKSQTDSMEVATRFIALAPVDNKSKQKWLYALSLTPVDRMRMTELCQKTTDETDSPYPIELLRDDIRVNVKAGQGKDVQFFFDMNAPNDDGYRNKRKGGKDNFREKRPKPEFDQAKCWFCLGSPNVEKHLVISIANECYLALAKGGLVSEHLLILPIAHHQASVGLPESCLVEINKFKECLKKFFEQKNEVPIFFERNYKTSHLQVQVIPIPVQALKELKEIFIDEASGHGFELHELNADEKLENFIQKGVPYFMVEMPNHTLYTRIRNNFPLQFGREVLASGPILDMPDRIEWQDCKLNETEEISLTQRFRKKFELFDFTL